MPIYFSDLANILKIPYPYNNNPLIEKFYIDTREIFYSQNAVFIALKGSRDGNQFVLDAYKKGIRYFIITKILDNFPSDAYYIQVEDSLNALQTLAHHYRKQFQIPIIGITGSNGKTIVKEWLNIFFSTQWKICKSPKSYNSQIGVPLSILELNENHQMGIFEAGISKPYEMDNLEWIIQPTEGVLTHMGDAHQEHFNSYQQKLLEKFKLFKNCHSIYANLNDEVTLNLLSKIYPFAITISKNLKTTYIYEYQYPVLKLKKQEKLYEFNVNFSDPSNLENLALCLMIGLEKNISIEVLQNQIPLLPTLPMRLELITDNQEFTFIIDTWSSDFDSLQQALYLLNQTQTFLQKKLVLTDFENLKIDSELFQYILKNFSKNNLYLIGKTFFPLNNQYQVFENVEEFIQNIVWEEFVNSVILLKGSRNYELERVYHFFNLKASTTYLKINLQQLKKNLGIYKSLLKRNTQMMIMLKADSYGSGSWEIAKSLENSVDYIGVAYTVEGIQLRKKGIITPIMVMNPDFNSLHLLEKYQLEPAVGSFELLNSLAHYPLNIHLEIETGMNRLGFSFHELELAISYFKNQSLKLKSVFTHLASTDNSLDDDFTHEQILKFFKVQKYIENHGFNPIYHCLNTSGIERFPQYQMDMVRLGIGLYGISNNLKDLQEIGKMYSKITRIHEVKKGESIGYNKSFIALNDMLVATIPVGYADGLRRSLSNGNWAFLTQNTLCPIVGKICMDMTMIDITSIPNAKVNDEVLIFGEYPLTLKHMAQKINTIPYECLVSISSRVKRIFVEE